MNNFWSKFSKPIFALAPMAGVTDSAFRQMCKNYGADVVYSEMASVAALNFQSRKTLELLKFDVKERPYVVQLFGTDPKQFSVAAKIIAKEVEPDGIDINFGCPVNKIQKQGAGAVLMNEPQKARAIIRAVIESTDLPVSIKTRTNAGKVDILQFLDQIGNLDIKAIMIHGRSLKQLFNGPLDVEMIKQVKENFPGLVLANGFFITDTSDEKNKNLVYAYYQKLLTKTNADGIGIARAALGRPWIFKALRTGQSVQRSRRAVFKEAIKHAELSFSLKGKQGIKEVRKHLCWYVQGLPGAKQLRQDLTKTDTVADIKKILSI